MLRIGVDLGGTKISAIALDGDNRVLGQKRIPTPRHDYSATLTAIAGLCGELESETGARGHAAVSVGIGIPGSISPGTGLVQNANSTWLNGRPFASDISGILQRPVRIENDANCFALSEATDGAGAGAASAFGVIIGTGCGGGIVVDGKIVNGPRGIGGEWGHTPLPWAGEAEFPGPECWCGMRGCLEAWISGPALTADHERHTGTRRTPEDLVELADGGDAEARNTFTRHLSRLGRGLAAIINIIDPEVIILGGGLSNLEHLYTRLPGEIAPYVFADHFNVEVLPPKFGDASGVRGAAWLWNDAAAAGENSN